MTSPPKLPLQLLLQRLHENRAHRAGNNGRNAAGSGELQRLLVFVANDLQGVPPLNKLPKSRRIAPRSRMQSSMMHEPWFIGGNFAEPEAARLRASSCT